MKATMCDWCQEVSEGEMVRIVLSLDAERAYDWCGKCDPRQGEMAQRLARHPTSLWDKEGTHRDQ